MRVLQKYRRSLFQGHSFPDFQKNFNLRMKFSHRIILLISIAGMLASCTSQKKYIYFQGVVPSLKGNDFKLKIYPGDILSIYVFALNREAFPFLTQPDEKAVSDSRSAYERGYVVNSSGELKIPLIGKVNLNGLTIEEATDMIEKKFTWRTPL